MKHLALKSYIVLICIHFCPIITASADPMLEHQNKTANLQHQSDDDSKDDKVKLTIQSDQKTIRDSNYRKRVEAARKRWKRIFEEIKSFDLSEGRNIDGTKFFDQWKVLLDKGEETTKNNMPRNNMSTKNSTKLMRQRFDGFSTWEKKLQQWSEEVAGNPSEVKKLAEEENETSLSSLSIIPKSKFLPRSAKPGEAILPHTDISDKSKNIWIVTTAALPWMTGTAVNPLLRAAYLSTGRARKGGSVTLMIPWLELESDRLSIYGKDRIFESPEEQEDWIRTWLRDTADLKQASKELKIKWYTGRVEKLENSIYSMGDITALLPEEEVDICVLEEPEHLNWYRAPGENWTVKFKHVVGIVHTNYFVYAQEQPAALIRAPAMKFLCAWMCRAHCHRIIKLSGTLGQFAPEKELVENVHGCRKSFLDSGVKLAKILKAPNGRHHKVFGPTAEPKVYFIGKMLWSKGLNYLMELLTYAEESADLSIDMDMYGGGPDLKEAQAKAKNLGLSMTFHGPIDHAALSETHKIFINTSLSEVLCTTVTEALAMGKFVIVPSHPSNDFFSQFPNCLTYANKEEFVGNLYYAITHSPEPLTKEYTRALSWEAANERFAAAGCVSVAEAEELKTIADLEGGLEIDLPPLIEDENRRKLISTTVKRTRSRFRQFRSNLSEEIRDSNVLPQELQNKMVKELDKRLDLDVDELLASPKLKVQLSPAELDRKLLEFYNSVTEGPGGDVLRMIGGGANVGRQTYYMKQQTMRLKRLQQQEMRNQKLSDGMQHSDNSATLTPEFLEDVGTGVSSTITKGIKESLTRNFLQVNTRHISSGASKKVEKEKDTIKRSKKDTPTMTLNSIQMSGGSRSNTFYSIPRTSFLPKVPHFQSKLPSPLI